MRRLHKDLGRFISCVICASMTCAVVLTACTVNIDRLNDGLNDLGDSFSVTSQSTAGQKESSEITIPAVIDESDPTESIPDPDPTPLPTATPIPTSTPAPQRVDFSFLKDEEIGNSFKVFSEEFSETGIDSKGAAIVRYEGNTVRVECENKNIQEAVNCMLSVFAKKADGAYASYYQKALAASYLTGLSDERYDVSQEMAWSDNGRLLSVIMHYSVTGPDGIVEEATDYATFDMLTGQYLTIDAITQDVDALTGLLGEKLIYAYMNPVEQPADDGDQGETDATTVPGEDADSGKKDDDKDNNDNKDNKDDKSGDKDAKDPDDKNSAGKPVKHEVRIVFIAAQKAGAETAPVEIYGTVDGNPCHTTVDLKIYAAYLNSFGKIVFGIEE